jgi:hypothetical protein
VNVLYKTKVYLVGHMQYKNGRSWRDEISKTLSLLNITCFDPYKKPFVKDIDEDENARKEMLFSLSNEDYDSVAEKMKVIRSYDLNLVDRSDFIIAHIYPDVASWGSAEEIVTAVRMKKPIFISVEGGKKLTPLWLLGMVPHKYIYDSIEDILKMIKSIDSGHQQIDSERWRLLRKNYR